MCAYCAVDCHENLTESTAGGGTVYQSVQLAHRSAGRTAHGVAQCIWPIASRIRKGLGRTRHLGAEVQTSATDRHTGRLPADRDHCHETRGRGLDHQACDSGLVARGGGRGGERTNENTSSARFSYRGFLGRRPSAAMDWQRVLMEAQDLGVVR